MNLRTIRKVVTTASTVAALTLTSLVAIKYGFRAPSVSEIRPAPIALEGKPSTREDFSFALLEESRPLPKLQFVDGDGRALTLADFRGKLLLLNIWATWCVPCRREMPTLDRLQARLGGPGFELIALSIDREGVAAVKAFYEELGLEALRVYVGDPTNATRDLGIVGIPTTLLVDRKAGKSEDSSVPPNGTARK